MFEPGSIFGLELRHDALRQCFSEFNPPLYESNRFIKSDNQNKDYRSTMQIVLW